MNHTISEPDSWTWPDAYGDEPMPSEPITVEVAVNFKLVRFNPRRQSRGADAAEVEVFDDDHSCRLWMSEKNIDQNIAEFGPHPELLKAKEHYRTKREHPERQ